MGLPPLFQKNPYPNGNYSVTEDFLEQLILILSGETGQVPIPESDSGYQDLIVDETAVVSLTVPTGAIAATIAIETDTVAVLNRTRLIRFKINGEDPDGTSGIALGDNDIYELKGNANLAAFKAIGVEKDVSTTLRVQYYTTTKQV